MSTSYSIDSSKSFMIAMQSMIDTVDKLNIKPGTYTPDIDNEVKKTGREKNEGTKLAVLAQDRNKWDDIYDQFNDVSFENLQKVIKSYKSSNSNNNLYKEFGKLVDLAHSLLPRDVFTESLLQIVYNNDSNALEKELMDFLGASNIELISFLIQNQSTIKSIPLEETMFMIQDVANPNKRLTQEGIRNQVLENAARAKNPKLDAAQKIIKYAHVYRKYESNTSSALSIGGQKFALPVGTTRMTYQTHEEIIIPAPNPEKNKSFLYTKLLKIKDLDFLCRSVFKYETLNQIQTLVYPVAYSTNENMLICAPTGAGKTDIALLTILNAIKQYSTTTGEGELDIQYDDFKVIYVAPLKALAAEIVSKFSQKLSIFDIKVRELTGDMQMTKA